MIREWSTMGAYVRGLPLLHRVQIRLSPADLARELFLQTQRELRARDTHPKDGDAKQGSARE